MSDYRDSILVSIGRRLQCLQRNLGPIDDVVEKTFPKLAGGKPPGLICVVGPPRSGTTLTYQVIRHALGEQYLTNLDNLLYALPSVSFRVSRRLCRRKVSTFQSHHGFVPGICGEAEGLRFWEYWLGQSLEDRIENIDVTKCRVLARKLSNAHIRTLISGYLGHVFSMDALRAAFPRVLFVHVHRDLLSNAYSLYRFSNGSLASIVPRSLRTDPVSDTYSNTVRQIQMIHRRIDAQSRDIDTVSISYEELCDQPKAVIQRITDAAASIGIQGKTTNQISRSFQKNIVVRDKDNLARKLSDRIRGQESFVRTYAREEV